MFKINALQKIVLFFLVFVYQTAVLAAVPAQVTKIRFSTTPEKMRLVFDLNKKVNYQINTTEQQITVQINDAVLATNINLAALPLSKTPIKSIHSSKSKATLTMAINLQHAIKLQHFWLPNPDRLVLDLVTLKPQSVSESKSIPKTKPLAVHEPEMFPVKKTTSQPIKAPKLETVPQKKTAPAPVKIAPKPASAPEAEVLPPKKEPPKPVVVNNSSTENDVEVVENPEEVTVTKTNATVTKSTPVKDETTAAATNAEPTIAEDSAPRGKLRDVIVVIDPGHGGKDPGATGPNGGKEKNVVLGVAKALQNTINQTRGFKAYLTRNGDYFLSLRQRLNIAHQYKADMLIAIHADAFNESNSHGASIFALSQRGATSEAARWLAEKENESELGQAMSGESTLLRSVLIDLSQTAVIGSSLEIGNAMLSDLKSITRLHSARVEQAAFVVLKSPDIPSLLVETGFISDSDEEANLCSHAYQKKLAGALAQGIEDYFRRRPPPGTYLASLKQQTHTKTLSLRDNLNLKNEY